LGRDDGSRGDDSLFGGESRTLAVVPGAPPVTLVASPAMRPTFALSTRKDADGESWAKLDSMLEWDRSPENVDLDELDGLLTGF